MTSDWKRVQVSEVCELIVDCVNKTAPRIVEPSEYKMLRTPNIKDGRVDRSDCRFVSRETYEKWTRRAKVLRGDVLLTREAPMGQVGLVDFDDTVFLGQRIMQYRADTSKILPEFLLYSFLSSDLQNQFKAHDGSGSVVSHIRVPDCSKFEIWLPPIVEQEFIVKQLRTLDLKISVNSNLNALLENLAQAIFKSWFVGFEPTKAKIDAREALLAENPDATPEHIATAEQQAAIQAIAGAGDVIPTEQLQIVADLFPNQLVESELGEIPDGWCIKNLEQICSLASGKLEIKSLTANNYISTENMLENRGGVKQASSLPTSKTVSEFKKGDILISNIRPYFKKIWLASFDGGRSNDVLCFRGINKISSCFLYCLLNRDEFFDFMMQTSKGAKMPRGDKQAIMRKAEVVPAYELQNYFSKLVRNFFNLIVENKKQNESLTMLRDTLLPKLLAGEIHID